MYVACISSKKSVCLSACVIALLASGYSHAADFAYEVSAGAGHSDNITRVENNEEDENIGLIGLRLSLAEQTARTQADVRGNVSYYDYLDDTYDSEVLGNLAGDARFSIVPDRFLWSVAENFGQVLRDPFQPSTPDNRENINQFATGPDLTLAFGSQMFMRLSGRYILTTYEDSPLDSDTMTASAALERRFSQASAISLNYQAQQTEYDEDVLNQTFDPDYDQSEAFVRYETEGARTRLALDFGYTEIERDATSVSDGGLLFRLDASRRVSAASVFSVHAGHEFANSGSAFASAQDFSSVDLSSPSVQQTAEPFTNEFVAIGWDYSRNRTGLSLSVNYDEQTYERSTQFNQTLLTASFLATRQMSQRGSGSFGLIYSDGSFDLPGGDYDEIGATLGYGWRLNARFSLNAKYDHWRRSSDQPNGDYVENRIWLTLSYGNGAVQSRATLPSFAIDQVSTP